MRKLMVVMTAAALAAFAQTFVTAGVFAQRVSPEMWDHLHPGVPQPPAPTPPPQGKVRIVYNGFGLPMMVPYMPGYAYAQMPDGSIGVTRLQGAPPQ